MLSLYKIVTEITARTGPRTGGFEIDKSSVENIANQISEELIEGITQTHFYVNGKNPITGEDTITKVILDDSIGNTEASWDIDNNVIRLYLLNTIRHPINNKDNPKGWGSVERDLNYVKNLKKKVYSLLMHELTHQFDPTVRSVLQNKKYKTVGQHGFPSYVNQPQEIRAHLQQVIEEIEQQISELRQKWRSIGSYKLMKEKFRKDPFELLQFSNTWAQIKNYLTPENEKRFLQTAFRLSKLI